MSVGYNRTCRVSDFADLREDWLDVFGMDAAGREFRKEWEIVQSVRGLRDFGALRPHARMLGIGAGHEWTAFYLTRHVEQVFCTDLYLGSGGWDDWANKDMLIDPTPFAHGRAFNRERLVVQEMDARRLWYPDGFFDGIFSASSIEHVGTPNEVAEAMREMVRVLKPGGVIAITTEFKVLPCAGNGWANVCVFDAETLHQYVIAPSGCDLVDEPVYDVDAETLATEQDLNWVVATAKRKEPIPTPHIVVRAGAYVFASTSVTLRKPL